MIPLRSSYEVRTGDIDMACITLSLASRNLAGGYYDPQESPNRYDRLQNYLGRQVVDSDNPDKITRVKLGPVQRFWLKRAIRYVGSNKDAIIGADADPEAISGINAITMATSSLYKQICGEPLPASLTEDAAAEDVVGVVENDGLAGR